MCGFVCVSPESDPEGRGPGTDSRRRKSFFALVILHTRPNPGPVPDVAWATLVLSLCALVHSTLTVA